MVWHAWFGREIRLRRALKVGSCKWPCLWTKWSVSTSDESLPMLWLHPGLRSWVKVARLPLEFRLFHSPRTSQETHTHTRHAPRQSLSLSSCEQSLVSRSLSVASLISCLSCVSCPLSVLFCFCLVFVFPPTVRLSVCLCLSVSVYRLSVYPVCVCGDLCLRKASQGNRSWKLVAMLTSKSFAVLFVSFLCLSVTVSVCLCLCLCLQVAGRGEWHPSLHQFMAIRAVSPALAWVQNSRARAFYASLH